MAVYLVNPTWIELHHPDAELVTMTEHHVRDRLIWRGQMRWLLRLMSRAWYAQKAKSPA